MELRSIVFLLGLHRHRSGQQADAQRCVVISHLRLTTRNRFSPSSNRMSLHHLHGNPKPCRLQHHQTSHHISPGSDTSPQSPHPSPGVQLTGGNRQIRTTVPPLTRGVTPVIAGAGGGEMTATL